MKNMHNLRIIILILSALSLFSCGFQSSPQKTVYKVYTLAQFTSINTDPRDFKYRKWINEEFGVSDGDYKEIVAYVEKNNNWQKLEADVGYEIMKTVDDIDKEHNEDIEEFTANVLVPYLWKMKRDLGISERIEVRIQNLYAEHFGLTNNINGLKYLISSYGDYNSGGYFSAQAINAVNESVSNKGFYLKFELEQNYVCLFKIVDAPIQDFSWGKHQLSIFIVERNTPCATPGELGYSTIESENVVVLRDKIAQVSKGIEEQVNSANRELTYTSGASEKIWRSIGIDNDLTGANQIMDSLIVKDFGDKDEDRIRKDLEFSVSLHEIKHKIDEIENPSQNINWDREISAHLTQVIFSNSPFYDLKATIQRIEGFYSISGDRKMGEVLKQLWVLADEVVKSGMSKDVLRNKTSEIYYGYIADNGENLLSLDQFGKDLFPMIWNSFYK